MASIVKSAQFGLYQMQPMYDWKNPKHKVIGYRVVSDVTLKLRDFTKIGALTEQLADIEDTQNQSVNYTLEDIEQAKAKASEDALKKARNQAASVATAGGRTLGELLYASVDVNQATSCPGLRAGRYGAVRRAHGNAAAHGRLYAANRNHQRSRERIVCVEVIAPAILTLVRLRDYSWPMISGSPFFGLPITMIFAFGLLARFSVASMPFHCNSCELMPWATICWKS